MGVRIGAPSFLIRRTSLVSSYSRYGLRYERLQVIRKIPARDQAVEACLRELASQLPRREHRQPRAHHASGSRDGFSALHDVLAEGGDDCHQLLLLGCWHLVISDAVVTSCRNEVSASE